MTDGNQDEKINRYLYKPIAYLEDQDMDNNGFLINPEIPKDKPVIVMVQAGWCPHCTDAKPDFQKFADQYKDVVFAATIQSDGERESEKKLFSRIKDKLPNYRGFPHYVLYINGKPLNREIAGRSVESLAQFTGLKI